MIESKHPDLPVGRQCALILLKRSAFYYRPTGESPLMALMGLSPI